MFINRELSMKNALPQSSFISKLLTCASKLFQVIKCKCLSDNRHTHIWKKSEMDDKGAFRSVHIKSMSKPKKPPTGASNRLKQQSRQKKHTHTEKITQVYITLTELTWKFCSCAQYFLVFVLSLGKQMKYHWILIRHFSSIAMLTALSVSIIEMQKFFCMEMMVDFQPLQCECLRPPKS